MRTSNVQCSTSKNSWLVYFTIAVVPRSANSIYDIGEHFLKDGIQPNSGLNHEKNIAFVCLFSLTGCFYNPPQVRATLRHNVPTAESEMWPFLAAENINLPLISKHISYRKHRPRTCSARCSGCTLTGLEQQSHIWSQICPYKNSEKSQVKLLFHFLHFLASKTRPHLFLRRGQMSHLHGAADLLDLLWCQCEGVACFLKPLTVVGG